ncbi:MAG: adenylate/guanylate cyclase domain-containing protein [Pseudomonadota bacterium]
MQALSTDLSDAPVNFSGSPFSRFGFLANFCTLGSVVMCFGQTFLVSAIAFFGLTSVDAAPHVQAVLMWVLALFAVIGLARDRRQHGDSMPLLLGIASLVILLATLYAYYHWAILTLAFFLLISAVFLNQNTALKSLYAKVQAQARQLEEWNQDLTARVNDQVERIERLDRLKHFLSPQVAELVMNAGGEDALASHRREITALFCDLRGFTAFSEGIEPEEAMDILQRYHRALDALIMEHNGTIDHRAGDGLMVIFNDPVPCDDPASRAPA